jgi:hypothetical protein
MHISEQTLVAGVLLETPIVEPRRISIALKARTGLGCNSDVIAGLLV